MSYMNSLIVVGEIVAQVVETLVTNNKAHLAFTHEQSNSIKV